MEIEPELLEILACPVCRESVRLVPGGSGLECGGCGRRYPIRDGIPVLLAEEGIPPASRETRP